ncbi:MAG: class I SAM-dependent methyltransferase [Bacteroidia bacterium]|nr:class I SAM-dependent methyltransferase [Bacteroidia bacterium]
MKIKKPEKRLQKFWGKVDEKHILSILPFIEGKTVLDIGCGNGSTTAMIYKNMPGVVCIGIDNDKAEIEKAKLLFPASTFQVANAEALPFPDNSFDSIIIRDALHHLCKETDVTKVESEIFRVSHPGTMIIIFDPNISFLLRFYRFLIAHHDPECSFETAVKIMTKAGFQKKLHSFNTIFSLPLSGGYVGINFVPDIKFIQSFILWSENLIERLFSKLKLGRYLCLRYLIVGERNVGM